MKLYLVQHGLPLSKQDNPERPLSEQGIREINNLARFLKETFIEPTIIFHSGKARARQTAEILQDSLNTKHIELLHGINPKDPVEPIIQQVNALNTNALIVGHMPFLGKMVSNMVCGHTHELVQFTPGTVVCLESQEPENPDSRNPDSKNPDLKNSDSTNHGCDWNIKWMMCTEVLRR